MKSKLLALFLAALVLSAPVFSADDKTDYYRGLELYHSGNFEAAVNAFRSQIKKTPDDVSVKKWLDLSQKRLAQDAAVAPDPDDSTEEETREPGEDVPPPSQFSSGENLYEKGISLYLSGDYAKSLEAFEAYKKDNPGHVATEQWITLVKGLAPGRKAGTPRVETAAPKKPSAPAAAAPAASKPAAPAAPAPAPKPASAAPSGPTAREKQLEAENASLKQELAKSEEMTRRAIEQTKKALALPQPSFESYEADSIRKNLMNEVDELRAREEDLLAEIERLSARKPAGPEAGAGERERELRSQVEALREELDAARRAAQAAEEAKASAQRKWAQTEDARRESGGEIEALRKSNDELGVKLKQAQAQLADARRELSQSGQWRAGLEDAERRASEAEDRAKTFEKRAEEALQKAEHAHAQLAKTERALGQAAAQYQAAEDAHSAAERREAQAARELERLRSTHEGSEAALAEKEAELAAARKQLSDLDALLEESRGQGLRLVMDAQKERQKREAAELEFRAEEKRLKSEIASLKEKLNRVLPQLEAVRSSLEDLNSASR